MKQQFTGSYTLDVASRTIVLSGIEIPPERLAVVINSTVGFVYHNIEHEPTATVTASGGDTTVVFPRYKDCETHRNSDALSIFYDDGVDLGQLIKDESDETQALLQAEFDETQAAITNFRTEVKSESDATQALLQTEFTDTRTALTDFRAEVKAESDATQALLQTEFTATRSNLTDFRTEVKAESDATQALLHTEFTTTRSNLTDFRTEVKAESDATQALLQTEFDATQTLLTDFKAEVKAEFDATQALLQAEFDATQTLLTDFKAEVKSESDATQALLQAEFDATQTLLTEFKTEVKAERDETQTLLGDKLPALAEGMVPTEFLNFLEPPNDVDVSYVGQEPASVIYGPDGRRYISGGYGPARIIYSRDGVTLRSVNLYYGDSGDALGKLVLVTPALWTPAQLTTRNAWFDASLSDSIVTDGVDVTAWNDRTANGFALVRYPSMVPAPKVGAPLFDLPTIAFDGSDGYLQSRLNGNIRSLTNLARNTLYQQEAIFIVARTKSDYFGTWLQSMGITADGGGRTIVDGNEPDRLLWRKSLVYEDQIRYDLSQGWSGAANSTHLLGFISTQSTAELYDTGRLVERHNTTGTARAGGWDRFGLTTDADFAEMLFLSEVPNEPTRQRIEGYLAHKWGLAGDLPGGHPYKSVPPGI